MDLQVQSDDGRTVRSARIALGGVAYKPWRALAADMSAEQGRRRFGSSNGTASAAMIGAPLDRVDGRLDPEPRSMRDLRWLTGIGMATASYPTVGLPAEFATCQLPPDKLR